MFYEDNRRAIAQRSAALQATARRIAVRGESGHVRLTGSRSDAAPRQMIEPLDLADRVLHPDQGLNVLFARGAVLDSWIRIKVERRILDVAASEKFEPALKSGRRRGRPPAADWPRVQKHVFALMDENGDFSPDDPIWGHQARLEEAVADFILLIRGETPAPSVVRSRCSTYAQEWRTARAAE